LSPPDLATLALLFGGGWWLLSKIRSGTFDWYVPTLWPVIAFVGVATISLLYSSDFALGARDTMKFAGAYCGYLVVMNALPNRRQLLTLLTLVVASALVPILVGWYQFGHGIGQAGIYRGGLRIQATFDHPNTYGFYLVSIMAAVWGLFQAVPDRRRLWVGPIAVATFVSMFLTLSRNTLAALALLVIVVGWRHRRALFGAAIAAAGTVVVMPRVLTAVLNLVRPRSGSNAGNDLLGRLANWQRDLAYWKKAPLLGHGWGSTKGQTGELPHNDYLRALGEGGVVGLLAFLVFIGSLVRASRRAASGRSDLPRAFFGLTLGYMVVSLSSNNYGKGAFQFYFWVLAAISYLWPRAFPRADDAVYRDGARLVSVSSRATAVPSSG
jgi:O-antigen ligase